jgi:hypothetical protein
MTLFQSNPATITALAAIFAASLSQLRQEEFFRSEQH